MFLKKAKSVQSMLYIDILSYKTIQVIYTVLGVSKHSKITILRVFI